MKLLNMIKNFIRKIFVDYHKIDWMIEEKSRLYGEKIANANSKKIEQVTNDLMLDFNQKISNISEKIEKCNQEIDLISNDNYEIKKELQSINESVRQLKYGNYEVQNINIDSNKKNILIIGFYGAPNLGDELMLETMLEYFEQIENKTITIMLAENPNYNIDKYKNVRFIHYPISIYDINSIAEKYDYIIFGGGAIIDDSNYLVDKSYQYDLGTIFVKLAIRAIAFEKKVISIGLSTSKTIKNKTYIDNLEYIINNSTYFSVRDEFSQKYIQSLVKNKTTKDIHLIDDIVIANKRIKSNIRNTAIDNSKINNVGIVYISNDNNKEKLKTIIAGVRRNYKNANINLIPFYEYCNYDTNFYENVNSELSSGKCTIINYPNNIEETISIFKDNDLIIGLRYHAVLLAYALNIPCIPVMYDINNHYEFKMEYLNKMFGKDIMMKYGSIDADEINRCITKIEDDDTNNYELCNSTAQKAQKKIDDIVEII